MWHVIHIVSDCCRYDTSSSICGGSNDFAACCIFFVHSHSISRNPIVYYMGRDHISPLLGLQLFVDTHGTPFYIKATWKDAGGFKAFVDTIVHNIPDMHDAFTKVFVSRTDQLILPLHLCDGFTRVLGHIHHIISIFKRERYFGGYRALFSLDFTHLFSCGNKTATDRVVNLFYYDRAVFVLCPKFQAVGMASKNSVIVEHEVFSWVKNVLSVACRINRFTAGYKFFGHFCSIWVKIVWREAIKAKNDGSICTVTDASESQ